MFPRREHPDHFFGDLAFLEEHLEHLVTEDGLQLLEFQWRRNAKHTSISVETAIGQEDVAVRIESEEVAERLHSDDRAGDGFFFGHSLLDEDFQRFPGAAAEGGEKFSIIQKVTAKDFGDAEDEMTMGHLFQDIHAEPLTEFHHALLVTGRAEMPSFTRECQQVFVAAVLAFHAGKTVAQNAAVEVTINHFFDICPPESVFP